MDKLITFVKEFGVIQGVVSGIDRDGNFRWMPFKMEEPQENRNFPSPVELEAGSCHT